MIETNSTGEKIIQQILDNVEDVEWTNWEYEFLSRLSSKDYSMLSTKQKAVVTGLFDKLRKGTK